MTYGKYVIFSDEEMKDIRDEAKRRHKGKCSKHKCSDFKTKKECRLFFAAVQIAYSQILRGEEYLKSSYAKKKWNCLSYDSKKKQWEIVPKWHTKKSGYKGS